MSATLDEDIQKVEDEMKNDRQEVLVDYLAKKSEGPQGSAQLGTIDEELREIVRQMGFKDVELWTLLEV